MPQLESNLWRVVRDFRKDNDLTYAQLAYMIMNHPNGGWCDPAWLQRIENRVIKSPNETSIAKLKSVITTIDVGNLFAVAKEEK